MNRNVRALAWIAAILSGVVLADVHSCIHSSDSNHTAFEPWLLVIVFLPTIALGMFALRRRALVAGTAAVLLGFLGVATLAFIDCTNTMVQYDRWLSRNMPLPTR